MTISPDHWLAVCDALGVDAERTVSVNISPGYVRVIFADQPTVSHPLGPSGPVEPVVLPESVPLDPILPLPPAPAEEVS